MTTYHIWDNYRIGPDEATTIEAESMVEAITEFVDTDRDDDPAGYFEFYGPGRELELRDIHGKKHRVQVKVELLLARTQDSWPAAREAGINPEWEQLQENKEERHYEPPPVPVPPLWKGRRFLGRRDLLRQV